MTGMMHSRTRILCIVLAALLLMSFMAACGGGKETVTAPPPGTAAPTESPPPPVETLGPATPEPVETLPPEDDPVPLYGITTAKVNLRDTPSSLDEHNIIRVLDKGMIVQIIELRGTWYAVDLSGSGLVEGYIFAEYVTPGVDPDDTGVSTPLNTTGMVVASTLRVRATPSIEARVAGSLSNGDVVTIVEEREGWYRISSPIEGWVSAQYIRRS